MDERTIELIHGEIDGANSPADHGELQRRLEASPEARQALEEMRALAALLAAAPAYEPPPGLRDAIRARIPQPVPRPAPTRVARVPRAWLGAAVAMAATAAFVAVVVIRAPEHLELDPSTLAGTIGQPAGGAASASLRLDEPGIAGTITLQRHERGLAIDVDLDSGRPVAMVATTTGTPLELKGFLPHDGSPAELGQQHGEIRLLHSGKQHYSLVLSSGPVAGTTIDLRFYDGDQLIREARLEMPADARSGRY
jgi:hypothetical protein